MVNSADKDVKKPSKSISSEKNLSKNAKTRRNSQAPITLIENLRIRESKQEDEKISQLRTFNNWAKSYLMLKGIAKDSTKQTIIGLDLGCSKGSDLKKWHHCNVEHLYLVENDPTSIQECRSRYSHLQKTWQNFYSATFIKEDMWAEKLSIPKTVDMVSCQMSLHKAFESRTKAENLAKNISDSLKIGGTFVASLTCSSKIMEHLQNCPKNSTVFGNSVFQIKLLEPIPEKVPEFGYKFQFVVGKSSFEEHLVQEFVLEQVMAKYGLILKTRKTFFDMYLIARKNPDEIKSMFKMGIIRESREKRSHKVYLTMSEGEREAATFFESVVFTKAL